MITLSILQISLSAVVKSVDGDYLNDDDFESLAEFFAGQENTRGVLILRSRTDSRVGRYFELTLADDLAQWPKDVQIILDYHIKGQAKPQKQIFLLPPTVGNGKSLLLGLTGQDWSSDQDLNAYQVTVLASNGSILSLFKSFGWTAQE